MMREAGYFNFGNNIIIYFSNYFSFGWLADGITVIPMHELRPAQCFGVGLNPSGPNENKSLRFDAYCFGVNP